MEMNFTAEQLKEVPCRKCDALIGEACFDTGVTLIAGFHRERGELRAKLPVMPTTLDATDKALIALYAFVLLADSVSANSEKMIGRFESSAQIQITFANEAINALRRDGFLGPTPDGEPNENVISFDKPNRAERRRRKHFGEIKS